MAEGEEFWASTEVPALAQTEGMTTPVRLTPVGTCKCGGRTKERYMNYRCLFLLIFALLMPYQSALAQAGINPAEQQTSGAAAPPPEDLRRLVDLLQRPDIQGWLQSQTGNRPVEAQSSVEATNASEMIVGRLNAARAFIHDMATAIPTLPAELDRARVALMTEMREQGPFAAILSMVFFVTLGFGLEWFYWYATAGLRKRLIAAHLDTVDDRLRVAGLRMLYALGILLAFAVGSIGAFLLFDWPPLLQHTVLAYLLVFLAVRLTLVTGRIVLAPGAERFRLMPMATGTARFWFFWSAALVGSFAFGHFTYQLLPMLGVGREANYIVALASGLILFGLALVALWRSPTFDGLDLVNRRHRVGTVLVTLYIITNWLVALSGIAATFYVGVILLVLPIAISCVKLSVDHIMRPPGAVAADGGIPSLTGAALERGLRALLLIGAAYLIASLLGVDFGALAARDTIVTRFVRGLLNAFVVILLADFTWQITSAWIDRKLMQAAAGYAIDSDELRRSARLRTLLPVFRNILFVVLLAMAILMALSSLGVEIGPLIAGAGVVGVAVGFGAQTLVKDIISGVFFLLDDAFRVGEYIESGSIKGTVESFSLRSIKIRHHRGALHTIPFGSLDKITNYSRDWAIDKIMVSVTYDTDLDIVKRVVKEVGQQLLTDEEIAPLIMETLKMQGVEQFGDFAIQIRMKIMTKPGEQAVIRRRAYALIKKAFDAQGIKFAVPTVSVAGSGDASNAVAQKALDLIKPPPPTGPAASDA
ncbi:small-conductance mechanosensitive channel [Sinorhizobium terangae]|uniref:Mechanosensitive ion channel n=1 Tax=Sinorhizobium terangae TaxID=110322 RepID=A0A6N7LD26_SINTE|nr:mechanosensitive ion channel family protein [Sinorhizobium terangae]MBB4188589.1 small-conductance mechanosensitive channel [Sinorhizobium terangae]MQX14604.1 mechanosensitive ion channel [Sinorhizobium terangae]